MKIDGAGGVGGAGKVKKAGGSSGDGTFGKMLDSIGGESEVGAVGGVSRISPIAFIEALDGDERSRKRKMVDDADDLLDELLKVRDSLLFGKLTVQNLRAVQEKISKIEANCDDPVLNELVEEIKIRASVELAKLGIFN
jgi:hypothetical protein